MKVEGWLGYMTNYVDTLHIPTLSTHTLHTHSPHTHSPHTLSTHTLHKPHSPHKVVDFKSPAELHKLMNFDLPEEGVSDETILQLCRTALDYSVHTGSYTSMLSASIIEGFGSSLAYPVVLF